MCTAFYSLMIQAVESVAKILRETLPMLKKERKRKVMYLFVQFVVMVLLSKPRLEKDRMQFSVKGYVKAGCIGAVRACPPSFLMSW